MSLTGDELTLNDKSYSITDKNGNEFNLGKLIKREKTYSPFHESYSSYNNIFEFENMPDKSLVPDGVNGYYNTKKFNEVTAEEGVPTAPLDNTLPPPPPLPIGGEEGEPTASFENPLPPSPPLPIGGKRRSKKGKSKKGKSKKVKKNRRKLTRRR
jgi:hypothetical protein